MKCFENPRIANWAIQQVQTKMDERHGNRTGALHASEIFQCFRKTVLKRTIGAPPLAANTILQFAVGQALQEFFFGPEKDGLEAFGIILSADRMVSDQVLEFKSTRMSYEGLPKDAHGKGIRGATKVRFDPLTNEYAKEWLVRCRAYCAAHSVRKAHIVVFFIYQSLMSAWTLEFTDEELAEAQSGIELRRYVITEHLTNGTLPSVTTRMGAWECKNCPFLIDHCLADLRAASLDVEEPNDN